MLNNHTLIKVRKKWRPRRHRPNQQRKQSFYLYFISLINYNCLGVQVHSTHPKTLEIAGSKHLIEGSVLNVSAPDILQSPAPQQGVQLFGAQRPKRPSAPANPVLKPTNLRQTCVQMKASCKWFQEKKSGNLLCLPQTCVQMKASYKWFQGKKSGNLLLY